MKFGHAAVYRPLVVTVFVFILLPVVYVKSAVDPGLAPRFLVTSVALVVCTLFFFFPRSMKPAIGKPAVKIIMLLFLTLAWAGFSLVFSRNTGEALLEWLRLGVLFSFFLFSLFIWSQTDKRAQLVSRGAGVAVLLLSFFAFAQLIPLIPDLTEGRTAHIDQVVSSTLANKNFFCESLVLLLPFLLYGLRYDSRSWKVFLFFSLLLDAFFLLLLQSVAAWVAVFIAGLFYFIYGNRYGISLFQDAYWKRNKYRISILVSALLVSGFLIFRKTPNYAWLVSKSRMLTEYMSNPALLSETRVENNNSVFERYLLWRNSFRMIADHPILGVGLNNWKIFNPAYGISGTEYINTGLIYYEHPHNDYLLVWAEQGPFGLFLYLSLFLWTIRAVSDSMGSCTSKNRQFLSLLVSGLIAFMVLSFFAYPRSRMYSMILLMTILSLILATLPGERKAGFSMKGIGILILLIGVSGSVASYCRVKGEMHTRKLLISQQQRNFARMIREADKAASWFYPMDLTSTPLAWYKGMAHYYSGNVAEAKRMYEEADRVNPNHLRVLNDLGTTCEKLGERDAAIRYYLRALSITPRSVEVNLNLSAVYFNKRNIDSAYYYIDRIYGLPMSWKEDKDYQAFLKAILYAKAYAFLIHPDDLDSLNSRYPFLDDDKILKAIYEQSKSENQPFTKKLRQFTPLKD